MATATKATAKPEANGVDPFASLTVETAETLFMNSGRPTKPIPPSVTQLVKQSYNAGTPKVLRVSVPDDETGKELRRYLQRAGEVHDPALTVRTTLEKDGDAVTGVRFKAGPKVSKGVK